MINGTINYSQSRNSWPIYDSDGRVGKYETDGLIYLDIDLKLVYTRDDELGKKLTDIVREISKEIYSTNYLFVDTSSDVSNHFTTNKSLCPVGTILASSITPISTVRWS
jgi:hypothetical protein